MKKVLLIGHGRHGKDTVAQMIMDHYGLTFKSSSEAAAEIFLFDALKEKYGYKSYKECFEDRMNHRAEWYDLICKFNKDDKARLAKEIMKSSDMYVGMRSDAEVQECRRQGLFDLVIGVYDPRKPLEPSDSFDIDMWAMADIVIPNAGTLEDLEVKVLKLRGMFLIEQEAPFEERHKDFYEQCKALVAEDRSNVADVQSFWTYWSEHRTNKEGQPVKGVKMRFEKQPTFDITRRFATWQRNQRKFSIAGILSKGLNADKYKK